MRIPGLVAAVLLACDCTLLIGDDALVAQGGLVESGEAAQLSRGRQPADQGYDQHLSRGAPAANRVAVAASRLEPLYRMFLRADARSDVLASFRDSRRAQSHFLCAWADESPVAAHQQDPVVVSSNSAAAITSLDLSPDDQILAVGSDEGCRLLKWPSQEVIGQVEGIDFPVNSVVFDASGSRLLVSGGDPAQSGIVAICDVEGRSISRLVTLGEDALFAATWLDHERFAVGGLEGTCWIIEAETGKTLQTLRHHSRGIVDVAWIGEENLLLTASLDESIRVIDWESGSLVRTLSNHTQALTAIARQPRREAVNPAAPTIIASSGHDRTIRFWQPRIGRLMRFARLESAPLCLEWMPDGLSVIAGCDDGTIVRIDASTLDQTVIRNPSNSPAWALTVSATGMMAVAGAETAIDTVTSPR